MLLWQLIIIQVITFAIIIVFLRMLFSRHLSFALRRLQQLHQENLEKEVALNKELERAKEDRRLEIDKGREEAKKIKEFAQIDAEKIRQEAILKSRQESSRIIDEANIEKERLKAEAIGQIEESAISLAREIMVEIFSKQLIEAMHLKLVDELIEELRKIDKKEFKVKIERIQVVTSHPLLDKQKSTIQDILYDKTAYQAEFEEKIDEAIISGLVIDLGSLVLDGSLSNKLRKIIPYLKK